VFPAPTTNDCQTSALPAEPWVKSVAVFVPSGDVPEAGVGVVSVLVHNTDVKSED